MVNAAKAGYRNMRAAQDEVTGSVAAIEHYDAFKRLGLAEQHKSDLIEYLK